MIRNKKEKEENGAMFELVPVIVMITAGIITASVGLRTLLKGPHITFSLQKADFCLYNREHEERISLLLAPVANKKQRFFGETAKKVSASVIFRAPCDGERLGLNASAGLPWMKSFGSRQKIVEQLRSEEDIQSALEDHLFDRTERDIPQGRGEYLIVAYGIEKTNKLYLASNPPIEIPLPPHVKALKKPKIVFTGCFFRLEIAGENLPSTLSEGSVIFGDSWSNWSFPAKVTTIRTPSKFRNLLLRLGIRQEVKVLQSKNRL
jgi:hypothetical protein